MKKLPKKLIGNKKSSKHIQTPAEKRRALEIKVEQGTDKAVREYKEVFRKLAEYDRT